MIEYTFIDLFAGAGGLSEGLLLAGDKKRSFRLLAASDTHQEARLTHEHRFRTQLGIDYCFLKEDIRSAEFPSSMETLLRSSHGNATVDVIVGGPPCQGFALFGLRNESDPRNDLFVHFLRVVSALMPKYFVLENVPGLELMYGRKTVKRIFDEVRKIGPERYGISGPIRINAADFGVPQLRERVVFIGHREDMLPIDHIPPTYTMPYITSSEALGDLAFLRAWESRDTYDERYQPTSEYQKQSRIGRLFLKLGIHRSDQHLRNHDAAKHGPDVIARFAMMEPGEGFNSIPRPLWKKHLSSSKKWCVRLHPDKPSFTVVTLPDDFVHYERPRILTVREMARLQSFDDTFEFLGPRTSGGGGKGTKKRNADLPQYTQVGNATPPLMACGIGEVLLAGLSGTYEDVDLGIGSLFSQQSQQRALTFAATKIEAF